MIEIRKIALLLLLLLTFSCSNKLSLKNINKPFYKNLKENVKIAYKPYEAFKDNDTMENIPKFKDYYDGAKYGIDVITKFRNKVIDSLDLLNKDNWLLITEYGSSYMPYQSTFIFVDNKCIRYSYYQSDMTDNGIKTSIYEENIKMLSERNEDIYEIYKVYKSNKIINKINIEAYNLKTYDIIFVKNNKIKSYQMTSQDYILKKW